MHRSFVDRRTGLIEAMREGEPCGRDGNRGVRRGVTACVDRCIRGKKVQETGYCATTSFNSQITIEVTTSFFNNTEGVLRSV